MDAVGIDIAKAKFDVALRKGDETYHGVFQNTKDGFHQFHHWLQKRTEQVVHCCMEATGHYGENLAEYLYQAGYKVSVVNPARIKAFGDSRLSRQKTDKADAELIALFCQSQQPEAWSPPDPALRELQAMVRHLRDLKAMRQQEANRLDAETAALIRSSLQQHLAFLDEQIAQLQQHIHDHFDQHPDLKRQRDLLDSIPGLGETTIPLLLAEIRDIAAFRSAAQLAAYAGVTPRHHRSGSSVRGHTRISKRGNPTLRAALYFPAMVALRHNPVIRAFGERLKANGLAPAAIVVAAIRKLLHLVFGVLKSQRPFDPNFAVQVSP
jgi:transposase